jgi:hypothetical protein
VENSTHQQLVTDHSSPPVISGGSETSDATQLILADWKKSQVKVVVVGWNTLPAPDGLTVPGETGAMLPFGLNPLTGPYLSAPAEVPIG